MSATATTPATALNVVFITESARYLLDEAEWVRLRDSVLPPDEITELVTTEETRAEFLAGATLLGMISDEKHALPQQLLVADMLNAGNPLNAILEPRRSTKTSSILAVMIGRCIYRPQRNSAFTLATNGLKAREKFREEVITPIEVAYPDPASRPVKIHKAGGAERLEFPNHSVFGVHPPLGDSFRGSAYDDVLIDEGGEAQAAMSEDLLAAIPPTFDTTGGQMIVSGTAGKFRDGNLFWQLLTDPKLAAGIVRYSVPDTVTDEEVADWEPTDDYPEARVRELVLKHHPGAQPGNLSPIEAVKRNFLLQPREVFLREYLGLFGTVGMTGGIFDLDKWARAGSGADVPALPERFSVAFAPHPDQRCVSIVAAWRDEDGKAVPDQLEWRVGIEWAPKVLLKIWRTYKTPIVYDSGSQVAQLIVETLNRASPRPKLQPLTFPDIKKAASLLVDELERGNVLHYRQPELDSAVKLAVKRKTGDRGWALGRDPKKPDDDITGAEAWSYAQLAYDLAKPKRTPRKARVAT